MNKESMHDERFLGRSNGTKKKEINGNKSQKSSAQLTFDIC